MKDYNLEINRPRVQADYFGVSSSPMSDFLKQNWGNLASVLGLLFSFLAFIFSKRASRAAKGAQEFVLTRSLGEDMNNASKVASEIVAYIRSEKSELGTIPSVS